MKARKEIFLQPIQNVLWCYGIRDNQLQWTLQQSGYQTLRGVPKEKDLMPHSICVLDDLLSESESSKEVTNMCTRAAHHKPCFVIIISQNIFPSGKQARTQSLNTHYFVIFKNPRDKLQFEILARQISPNRSKNLISVYEVVSLMVTYLLILRKNVLMNTVIEPIFLMRLKYFIAYFKHICD